MTDLVFVSYSRRDAARVLPVVDRLRGAGLRVWMDQSDIPASVPWMEEITQAIRGAVLVVVFESFDWHSSPNCAAEIDLARRHDKPTLYVDAGTMEADAISDGVTARLSGLDDRDRATAELLQRSHRWHHGGRRGSELARGSTLGNYRDAVRERRLDDPQAVDFVKRSRRRSLRRTATIVLAGVLAAFLIVNFVALQDLNEELRAGIAADRSAGRAQRLVNDSIEADPYLGLEAALALGDATGSPGDARTAMTHALGSVVPVEYVRSAPPAGADVPAGHSVQGLRVQLTPDRVEIRSGKGQLLRSFPTNGRATSAALAPDGHAMAIAEEGRVRVVDLRRANLVAWLQGVPDVTVIAWAGDGTVHGWTSHGWRATWLLERTTEIAQDDEWWFMDAAMSAAGDFAAISRNGQLVVTANGSPSPRVVTQLAGGFALAVDGFPGGWLVTTSTDDGDSSLVVVPPKGRPTEVAARDCAVPRSVVWSERHERAYVACGPSGVGTWRPGDTEVRVTGAEMYDVSVVAPVGDDILLGASIAEYAVAADGDPARTEPVRFAPSGCMASISDVDVVVDSSLVYSVGALGGLCSERLDLSSSPPASHVLWPFAGTPARASDVDVSDDGQRVVLGTSDGQIWVFTQDDWTQLQLSHPTGSEIRGVRFTPDGRAVMAASRDGEIFRIPLTAANASLAEVRHDAEERLATGRRWGLAD